MQIMYAIKWLFVRGVERLECSLSADGRVAAHNPYPDEEGSRTDYMQVGSECFHTEAEALHAAAARIEYALSTTRVRLATLECLGAELRVSAGAGHCERHAMNSANAGEQRGQPCWPRRLPG